MSFLSSLLAFSLAVSSPLAEASPFGSSSQRSSGRGFIGTSRDKPYGPPGAFGRPAWRGSGKSAGSPPYPYVFGKELPIPEIAQPSFTETVDGKTIQFYESTISPVQKQIYPDLGPANMVAYGK